jgi:xylan 1,4-beta-xylosidase
MKSHLKKRFVSLKYFLPQSFAPSALSSRLCEKVKRSRKGAKREKLEAQRVSVFEARSHLLSLCCLFALSLALITISRSTTAQSLPSVSSTAPLRLIAADYSRVKGKHDKFFRQVVGAGRAAEGLRADWQRDLDVVHRECGFKYIRFHGLLQDEMGVYSEGKGGQPIYNFQYVDALYDAILKVGMKPFVELSFMPQALASGNKFVFWWKGNITPPKDYGKWERLIETLIRHWTARYGVDEVKQWYFEVWNEPNLDFFWSSNQAEYFKLYAVTARAIKSVSADYRVGGPATAGRGWITETINFTTQNCTPLDFITTHDYGVSGRGFDENGVQQLYLITEPEAITAGVRDVRAQIKSSSQPDLPLHYTEWSTSYSPRDPVHDSYISAPYILSKLKGSEGYADSMSYWTFTDIFEENGPVPSPFHGGFGLLNFQGLRKPSFYAYQFLNRLGDVELISDDADSWACRSARGVQLLFWNYTPPKTTESDQVFFKKDLPARDLGQARVSIANLPPGDYRMSVYRIGYRVNDVYDDYLQMGSPATLSREQVRELAEKTDGRAVETSRVRVRAGQTLIRDVQLRENDVYLITLEK